MARKSKVYDFPEELLNKINKLLLSKKATLKQLKKIIADYELKHNVDLDYSNGSLGRYKKNYDKVMGDFQVIHNLTRSMSTEDGFRTENTLHQLISQLANKSALDILFNKDKDQSLTPKELADIAQAVKNLMSSTQTREKIKVELEKEIKAKQVADFKEAKKQGTISEETFEEAKRIIGFNG